MASWGQRSRPFRRSLFWVCLWAGLALDVVSLLTWAVTGDTEGASAVAATSLAVNLAGGAVWLPTVIGVLRRGSYR